MTDLIPRTTISTICAHRDAAMSTMQRAVDLMEAAHKLAEDARAHAEQAHGAATFTLQDRSKSAAYRRLFEPVDAKRSLEAYRQQIDSRIWENLFTVTGMYTMMDRTERERTDAQLCEDPAEVIESTVWATFERLRGDAGLIFQRGLARAFIDLDRRFKSHDAFKIGARIILTHVFDDYGSWYYHGRARETICDVERVFAVLDGNPPDPHGLLGAIDAGRGRGLDPRQSLTESTYFRIRGFKNGNAHLWFTRDDLVEKANRILADYYGEVLPDGVSGDVTDRDIRAKSTALCKDLQFYPTPDPVMKCIAKALELLRRGDRVLEPSAGDGAIVRHLLAMGAKVDAIEVDPGRVSALRMIERKNPHLLTVTHANFLQTAPRPVYDFVVMNPPFFGTHYQQHVMHAWDFLAPRGTLIAILPATVEFGETKAHVAFRTWLDKHKDWSGSVFQDLPAESFASAGTRINTCYVVLRRRS